MRGACERRTIAIEADVEQDLPPVPIDGTAILQVLLNVLHNAVDASPSKTGRVTIAASIPESGEFLEINVTDNGGGIEPGRRETVFVAFHTTKGQRGTGLGLAVAKKIVLEHQGTIELLDGEGGGTRCRITLPLSREDDPGDTHSPT